MPLIPPKFGKKSRNTLESNVTEVPVEVPERRLYAKCPGCKRVVDIEEITANQDVCPHCGHHMRLSARRRIELTCDELERYSGGTWVDVCKGWRPDEQ